MYACGVGAAPGHGALVHLPAQPDDRVAAAVLRPSACRSRAIARRTRPPRSAARSASPPFGTRPWEITSAPGKSSKNSNVQPRPAGHRRVRGAVGVGLRDLAGPPARGAEPLHVRGVEDRVAVHAGQAVRRRATARRSAAGRAARAPSATRPRTPSRWSAVWPTRRRAWPRSVSATRRAGSGSGRGRPPARRSRRRPTRRIAGRCRLRRPWRTDLRGRRDYLIYSASRRAAGPLNSLT